jgi:hypothetical protein
MEYITNLAPFVTIIHLKRILISSDFFSLEILSLREGENAGITGRLPEGKIFSILDYEYQGENRWVKVGVRKGPIGYLPDPTFI